MIRIIAICVLLASPSAFAQSARCLPLYPAGWKPVMGQDKSRPARSPKPQKGKPFADATFKTCVVRATDHDADGLKGFARTDYSRRQAFSADDSRFLVGAQDGSWHLYDTRTLQHVVALPGVGGDAEPQWHPTNPNLLYYFPAFGIGMQLFELDVSSGRSRVVADLAARIKALWPTAQSAWTKAEGSPSTDARYWALMVDDKDWHGLGMLTYDLVNDKVLASYDLAKNKKSRPDHVSMSPSGNYVVVSWDDGTYSLPRDLSKATLLQKRSEHSDLALDGNGDDTYVSIDYGDGYVFMINLRTGVRTSLFPTYLEHTATAMHFSGKAFRKRGWVLVSTYAEGGGPWQWLHGKVFALELKANPRIVNLAHHHVIYDEYFSEPHATVNRDFTKLMFNSNWDNKSKIDIDTYLIELPPTAIP